MAVNQVQLRLSIDGQQALSTIDALGIKQADLMQATKAMTEARTQDMNSLKNGLVEIYKLQEKQALLEKQMAAASASGKLTQLSKLEGIYEANSEKLTQLFEVQTNYNEAIHLNDLAILENTKTIKFNNTELEKLYISEGRILVAESKLVTEKRALTREASLAGNGSDRQRIANEKLLAVEKELTQRTLDRAKAAVSGMQKVIKEQGIEKVSTQDLITLTKSLETANKHRTDRFTDDAKDEIKSIKQVNAELAKRKEETAPDEEGGLGGMLKNLKGGLPSAIAGATAGMFVGMAGELTSMLVGAVSSAFGAIKKQARDVTDIQVALNVSRDSAQKIKGELNDIRTETTVEDLKKLVEVAGDLNVAEQDIKAFVAQADQFGVVMGRDFGTGLEESVSLVAKLKGEFKETRELNYPESLAKIGSTLKQLNLDGPASVPGITDFLKRVGAIPDAIKPALPELAALGAVFEEANLTAEIAGSGYSKLLTVASNNAALFGKQMRMSKQEVENLINTNPNEFAIKFAESLKGLSGTDFAKTLKGVKLESDEVMKVVAIMTDNIGKLREKQELANKTFQEGTTITNTFNKYLNDEAGQIAQIEKAWSRVTNGFVNWLTKVSGPVILSLAGMAQASETAAEAFDKQDKKTTTLNKMLPSLVSKYETLSLKTEKSAEDQERLNAAMQNIANIVPGAVSQYDDFGRVLKINIGIVNDFLEAQNLLQKQTKFTAINERNKINNNLGGQRKEILDELRKGEKLYLVNRREGIYESRKLTDDEIIDRQKRLASINQEILANKKRVKEYNNDADFKYNEPPKPTKYTTPNISGTGKKDKSDNKAENERIRKEKFEQTQRDNMIELQAKLAFEEKMAVADDEQKKILQAEKRAKDELHQVRTQFKDIDGLVIKHADLSEKQQEVIDREVILIKKRLAEEKINIEREYLKKQDDVYEAHANKAIQIANDAAREELQKNLNNAKRQGGRLGIFNAEERIINNDEATDTFSEIVKYLKEQEAAKDNAAALILIEENHRKAIEAIQTKYRNRRDAHIADATEKEKDIAEKHSLNSLGLDVREDEQSGRNPLKSKIALLNAQKALEIANADKTGASIADIERKYRLERAALEHEDAKTRAEKALHHFQQAFGAIANIGRATLESKSIDEEQHYNDSIRRIDQEADRGILTARQHTKQKMALDKEHDKAQRKIKLDQFNLDKAANIANIIMQTALAVMKASPNIPLMVVTGVLGAVELGIAASQKPPAYDIGGSMPDSFMNPVDNKGGGLIIAHPGEYMIPKWIRQSPVFANIEPVIEQMRLSGRSYEIGGAIFNSPNPTAPQGYGGIDLKELAATVNSLTTSLSIFKETLQTPITAHTAIGEEEIYKLEQERGKLNKKLEQSYGTTNKSLI
jgi:hypothetical protein